MHNIIYKNNDQYGRCTHSQTNDIWRSIATPNGNTYVALPSQHRQ